MSEQSLRERIYCLTKPLHDRLDGDPASLRIMSEDVSLEDYKGLLARTYGFMQPLEYLLFSPTADALLQPVLGSRVRRAGAILRDLEILGVTSVPTVMKSVPVVSTVGQAMGVSYVIEGSQMGGLVMAKQLSRRLGLTPENGLGFFLLAEPKETVKQFQSFVAGLDSFARCDCDEQEAIESAAQTFRLIGDWFSTSP